MSEKHDAATGTVAFMGEFVNSESSRGRGRAAGYESPGHYTCPRRHGDPALEKHQYLSGTGVHDLVGESGPDRRRSFRLRVLSDRPGSRVRSWSGNV